MFDGVCKLCNWFVRFVVSRDPHGRVRFVSLQSRMAQSLLEEHHGSPDPALSRLSQTVVFVECHRIYTQSTAVLKVVRKLDGAWPLLYAWMVVPTSLRDMIYRFVARNRYKWFGKSEQCMVPSEDLRKRFLDE